MAGDGPLSEKLSWQEWHCLEIRQGPDWQRRIDALPATTRARLAQGVVDGDAFPHVVLCVQYARRNVVEGREIAGNGERGLASGRRAAARGAPGRRRDESSPSPGPLTRTSTRFGRAADREQGWSQMLASVVVVPLAGRWCYLSWSWYKQLWPTLQAMRNQAASFAEQHPIAGEVGGGEMDASVQAWHAGINRMQQSFRQDSGVLFASGAVSSASSVVVTVAVTLALLYLTTFLPEGAVLLPEAAQRALRRPLNAVNSVRAPLGLLAFHQVWLLWAVLRTAFEVAATMEANVNDLKKQAVGLAGQGVQLNAQQYDGRRWGVKILGFTVDKIAWRECRLNVAVAIALLVACSHVVWGWIQAKREAKGMRETSWLNKMTGDAKQKIAQVQQEKGAAIDALQQQVDDARLQVQRSSAFIPFESLKIGEKLGGGSFGTVYRGVWHRGGGVRVAIKKVKDGTLAEAEAEVGLLLRLRHPNIVSCFGQSKAPAQPTGAAHLYIVTELCGKYGSLYNLMHRTGKLNQMSRDKWLVWMNQIASGMTYLHNEGVLHRDLKSENVLVTDDRTLKICDFGLSRVTAGGSAEHLSKADTGTYIYVAPEVVVLEGEASQVAYTTACDIYSYAVLINEMASMTVPWAEIERPPFAKQYIVFNKVKTGERPSLAVGAVATPEFQQLVQDCWSQHPGNRPAFDKIQERLREL